MGAAGASSIVTAEYGGFSSWSNGDVVTSFGSSNAILSLQPLIIPYAITVSNVVWLASLSTLAAGATSGTVTVSAALYTINGGTAGTLSLASSGSTSISFNSAAGFSSWGSLNYWSMSVNSWALTPGPYVLGFVAETAAGGNGQVTFFGNKSQITIASGLQGSLTNQVVPGFSSASITTLPTSIAISDTTDFVRTGSLVYNQPWILFQGT
jgi:hypothetical protein